MLNHSLTNGTELNLVLRDKNKTFYFDKNQLKLHFYAQNVFYVLNLTKTTKSVKDLLQSILS